MNPTRQETWSFMKNSMILLLVFALSMMSTNIDPGVLLFAWHWFIDKALANAGLRLASKPPLRYGRPTQKYRLFCSLAKGKYVAYTMT